MVHADFDGILLEMSPYLVFFLDTDHVICKLSKSAVSYFGFPSPEAAVGVRILDVVANPVLKLVVKKWLAAIGRGLEVDEVFPLLDEEMHEFSWYKVRANPVSREGRLVGSVFIITDVTGHIASKTILNSLVSSLPGEVVVFDRNLAIILGSDVLARENGFSSWSELAGKTLDELPNLNIEIVREMIDELIKNDEPVSRTFKNETPSGLVSWYRADLRVIKSSAGTFGYILTQFDVTAEIKPKAILESLMDSASELITVINPDERIEYASMNLASAMGFSNWRTLVGKHWRFLFKNTGESKATLEKLFLSEGISKGSRLITLDWPSGTTHLDFRMDELTFEGEPFGRFGIAVNMTDLVKAREAAESALKVKAAFLANVTHELRTPMNAVLGLNELLSRTELTAIQRNYAAQIRSSASLLLSIINDILDFSKIEARKLELDESPYRIEDTIRDVSNLIGVKAHEKDLSYTVDIDPLVPAVLLGDEVRVKQILINLLNNAVKFTPKGEVRLSVSSSYAPDGLSAMIRLSVRDTGIGIPKERQARLFERFSRVDEGPATHVEGTGLGLSICKGLAFMMGGSIRVESDDGAGSVFVAEIRQKLEHASRPLVDLSRVGKERVLVYERDKATLSSILAMARSMGLSPTVCRDMGELQAALTSASESKGDGSCDLTHVIFEYASAYELVLPFIGSCSKVRWLSLLSLSDFLGRGKDPSVSFVFKPLLITTFARFLAGESVDFSSTLPLAGTLAMTPPSYRSRGARALVVDDNEINRKVADGFLKSMDISIVEADSGAAALERARENPGKAAFDIVLMDHIMPGMDGIETSRRLRKLEGYESVPIIAFTAIADDRYREQYREAGINDVLYKPIELAAFIACVRKWIAVPPDGAPQGLPGMGPVDAGSAMQVSGVAISGNDSLDAPISPGSGPGAASAGGESRGAAEGEPWIAGLDREAALRFTGNEKNLEAILKIFAKSSPSLMEKLEAGRRSGDPGTFRVAAHSLISSCANVGAMTVSKRARALEDAIIAGSEADVDRIYPEVHASLREAIDGVARYVKERQ